jgi:zinc transporter, ZIP family
LNNEVILMSSDHLLIAFLLTLFAGLATGIGSAVAFFTKITNNRFLSLSLGFSAGVMIYVSFVELFMQSKGLLVAEFGKYTGMWFTIISFFCGMLLIAFIDNLVPSYENPHEIRRVEKMAQLAYRKHHRKDKHDDQHRKEKLLRMGTMSAIAIAIHNFPEGIATFTAAMLEPKLGISIAVAIAIHNIPEGISISVPIYFSTGNKRKAFFYSFLSGLAEPLGAIIGYFLLVHFLNNTVMGVLFGAVAGIMIFISLDELLPAAREYGQHHWSIYGLIAGMGVMAVSLILMI